MKIKVSGFCNLSRAKPWQEWLKVASPELSQSLFSALKGGSCRANTSKMVEIYNELYKKGLGPKFELFMKTSYPYLIESEIEEQQLKPQQQQKKTFRQVKIEDTNNIFKNYIPNFLTFPHRIIFKDSNINALKDRILKFIIDKVGVDYIIIGDLGYVEYFDHKYSSIVDKIDPSKREIAIHRKKNAISS